MRHSTPALLLIGFLVCAPAHADRDRARKIIAESQQLILRGEGHKAKPLLDEAIKEDPTFCEPWIVRANVLVGMGFTDAALRDVTEAIRLMNLEPHQPSEWALVYFLRSGIYFDLDRYADALKDAVEAERLVPEIPIVKLARGKALHAIGEQEDGLRVIESVMPHVPEAAIHVGPPLWVRGEWGRLLEAADRAAGVQGLQFHAASSSPP